uniref:Aminotransferase-like plant mobile domain-containing protein n=1 Tax=Fagus sylvatica TaxID=28930 RepID=A0A2N9H6U5_FAGSY
MASSSRRSAKGRGGTFPGKGGSPEPLGDILGRPTVDPWYRSGERFPSVLASLQPPPADWEWLVMRKNAAADVAWTPNFREIRDLQIQRNEMLAVPLVFYFQCSRAIEWADWIDSELADREFLRRWCPSTHTFFFAHGEMTVTLEDIENHWLLPVLGDQDPAELELSPEELKTEAALADYIGRKNVALGTQAARFNPWMEHFNRVEDASIRRAAFCGLYTQLDLLHAEELAGASCHIVTTALNSSIVHTFLWEHALEYIRKGRKPYEARNKFASIPEAVIAHVGDFQGDVPAVYRWVGSKFYDHSLIPSLDSGNKVCWRPYGVTHRGFSYESVMSGLPVLSSGRLQFTVYSAHRVRRQFGFDQEIPAVMGVAAGEIPTINPFLKARAFAYWSGIAPRVIVPSGDRVGIYTTGMSNYWRGLMAAMVDFRNSRRGRHFSSVGVIHFSVTSPPLVCGHEYHDYLCKSPKLGLCLPSSKERRTASVGTPATKGKQSSKSKKREAPSKDSPAQASKKRKTNAVKGSKEVLVLKTAVQDPSPAEESTVQGVSASLRHHPLLARVAARKSTRGVVYSEKRSKQRADTVSRVPIEIPDDLSSSSSSSSDEGDPSGTAAERAESTTSSTSSREEGMVSRTSAEEDKVSMDELRAAEAAFDSDSTTSASKPKSAEGTVEEHTTVEVVTSAERAVETTPITIATSGETSTGSSFQKWTISATIRVSTPPSPLHESGSVAPSPVVMAIVVPTAVTIQDSEAVPAVAEEVPDEEEVSVHIPDTPEDDIDMADAHDSYDEVLAQTEDHVADAQAADMEVTTPIAAHASPTETVGSGNEAVAEEEERRHQTAAVESAIRGQPGLLSAARSATLGSSVLADMDVFFREFDRTSFSSRHAEHFWIFDDVKADFEIFRVPQGGIRFLKALWEKYGSCSSYFQTRCACGKLYADSSLAMAAEARVAALRDALNMVAPNPWDLASARRVSAESHAKSALHGLLA